MLPIPSRGGGGSQGSTADAAGGRESSGRGNDPLPPILSRAESPSRPAAPKPVGLPITGRGGGLPIASRTAEAHVPSELPTAASGTILPVAGRGQDVPGSYGPLHLPAIAPAPTLPSAAASPRLPIDGRREAAPSRPQRASHARLSLKNRGSLCSVKSTPRQLLDDYNLGEVLGEGAFSVVYACYPQIRDGDYAVKMVDKVESPMDTIKQEVLLLDSLKHANIVKYIDVYWEKCFVCIVLERYRGGDLFNGMQLHWDTFGPIPCEGVINVKRQMISAVRFLQQEGVVHRDVKGDNYLLDRDDIIDRHCKVTLTDFGTACRVDSNQRLSELVGTRTYWSPEFFKLDYGPKVDDWAVGIVICGLVTGAFPFNGEQSIKDLDRPAKIVGDLPAQCLDLVQRLLEKDESKRMTAAQAADHPWLAAIQERTPRSPRPILYSSETSVSPEDASRLHREAGPDSGIRERRMELFDRLEIEAMKKKTTIGYVDAPLSTRTRTSTVSVIQEGRFETQSKHEKKTYGYEWWPKEKAHSSVECAAPLSSSSAQVLRRGDKISVTKEGGKKGHTGVVAESNWYGLVKVTMDETDDVQATRSYKLSDVDLIPELQEGPTFANGDLVRILTSGVKKGQLAEVLTSLDNGKVKVRLKDSKDEVQEYAREDLEQFVDDIAKPVSGSAVMNSDDNVQAVGQMLEDHDIDTSVFGIGQAKSLAQFAQEVKVGASQLMLDATEHRKLVRVVDLVLLRICLAFEEEEVMYLVECGEKTPDGHMRHKSRLLGSKKEPHENTRKVSERIIREVLDMDECKVSFDFTTTEVFEVNEESVSYPGVRTVYRKEIVEGWVTAKHTEILDRIGRDKKGKWSHEDNWGNLKFFEWLTEDECDDRDMVLCAPEGTEAVSCLVRAPVGFSEDRLITFLSSHGVDPDSFGQHGSRTLKELSEETKRGETSFVVEPEGRLLRVVDVVLLKLSRKGGSEILVQTDEAYLSKPDDVKVVNRLPGQKLRPVDNQFMTAYLIASKKLNISENCVNLHPDSVESIASVQQSASYPGILTLYRRHVISGEMIEQAL